MELGQPLARGLQIGLDIGQQVDQSAVCVVERQLWGWTLPNPNHQHPDDRPVGGEIHYVVRYIARMPLKTPYPAVAKGLGRIYHSLQPAPPPETMTREQTFREKFFNSRPSWEDRTVRDVLVDATGVGQPVVDLIEAEGVHCTAVLLTSGSQANREGSRLNLPKGELVSNMQVLFQNKRIHMDSRDQDVLAAVDELLNYEIRVTEMKHVQTGVFKVGEHDDLATALGLACWEGNQPGTIMIGTAPKAIADFFMGGGDSDGYSDGNDWTFRPFGGGVPKWRG